MRTIILITVKKWRTSNGYSQRKSQMFELAILVLIILFVIDNKSEEKNDE